jgi:hypothetical protein
MGKQQSVDYSRVAGGVPEAMRRTVAENDLSVGR